MQTAGKKQPILPAVMFIINLPYTHGKEGFIMIKLIASDMDGTLLDENSRLPKGFHHLLDRLAERGICFAAASGRQYVNLADCFGKELHRMICMSNNGALVKFHDEVIYCRAFEKTDMDAVIAIGRTLKDGLFIASGVKSAYIEKPLSRNIDSYLAEMPAYFSELKIIDSFSDVRDEILNFSVCDFRGTEKYVHSLFSALDGHFDIKVSGEIWLDISLAGNNKGAGLRAIQSYLGVSRSETAAFGDFLNDSEMLMSAKFSFAMDNSHPELFRHAAFRAPSNRNNGVLRSIEHFLDHPEQYI